MADTTQAVRRWATEPHIRFGDPCHDCGRPMTPASREWARDTIPAGYLRHAGRGLCGTCYRRRHDAGTLNLDVLVTAPPEVPHAR